MITIFTHSVRPSPSVRSSTFQNRAKQNNFQVRKVIATRWIVNLAKGIIDDNSYCIFQAAKDTKHRMGPAAEEITILHFNDVYNVESREQEPIGGAARFLTAMNSYDHLSPMILFSGDIFAPSLSKNYLLCSIIF